MTKETHRARPFRVHALAEDFELHDVWSIPIDADPARDHFVDFFRLFVENGAATDSRMANALFRLRLALGKLFRLDPGTGTLAIPGTARATVADRLEAPDRARDRSRDFAAPRSDFRPVYVFDDEALIEISNKTIHALIHLGWVDAPNGRKTASLAVYVKSRGWFSDLYMALIGPFRHLIVYPAWFSRIGRRWAARPLAA